MTTGGIRGSLTLAGVVVLIWTLLYLITQLLVSPALPVLPTLGIGVALTVGVVLGYPSALRGPRGGRSARLGASHRSGDRWDDPERSVRDLAAAGRSVPLRAGLTPDAARRTCELLRPMLSGDAVTITDRENILAFVGPGSDHLQTRSAQRAMG